MIVAFDFDKVMDDIKIQIFAKKLISERNEVWVVTARKDNDYNHKIIDGVIKRIGLSKYNVIYCDEKPKYDFLQAINADLYIDNINNEFQIINNHTKTIPVLYAN